MNIYVVRHGETDWNKNNMLQGKTDIELNENGIESAKILAEKLKDVKFDIVYSSPLKRALDTAKYICKEKSYKIQEDSRLIERSFGDYEGKKMTKNEILDYWNYNLDLSNNNVESIKSFIDRVYVFLKEIYLKYEKTDFNILIVAHNGISMAIESIINGFPKNFLELRIKNCEYKIFEKVNIKEENYKKE